MKKLLILIFLSFISSCDFPNVVSGSFSKEFCSCYFLIGHDEKKCYDYAKQIIEISEYKINQESKSIWSKGLGRETVASFISNESGCKITKQN